MKYTLSILYLLLVIHLPLAACTTAIISGKYTVDGRPLLYKHRDTSSLQNKLMAFSDGKYEYIGIVNSSDKEGKEVWGGYNSAGFAIMNSASYNLNPNQTGNPELEGVVMKLALQRCATVEDFELLLDSLPKPMYVSANFGVIDAQGGAAYYETGDYEYTKYDANDISIAPKGYIIRTNFSEGGDRKRYRGSFRYDAAFPLFYDAATASSLSYRFLIEKVSRHLTHGLTEANLYDQMPASSDEQVFVPFRDYIPRYTTSSVIVVQGVKKVETPRLTTMWTILGSPLTTVTIPVWLNKQNIYPAVLTADDSRNAKLCTWGLELKKCIFPITEEEGKDYINLAALISTDKNGILQKVTEFEKEILNKSDSILKIWREEGIDQVQLEELYSHIDKTVTDRYTNKFLIPENK